MSWVVSHHTPPTSPRGGVPTEDGQDGMAGLEVLPFGVLIFVMGSLVALNAWAVIDARLAASSAAREAARAYVESPSEPIGRQAALEAAREAVAAYRRDPDDLELRLPQEEEFGRCHRVTFTATLEAPTVRIPLGQGWGRSQVTVSHVEIVDPLRGGLEVGSDGCY